MSGELNRLQMSFGGASYDEWDGPISDPFEQWGVLYFPPDEQTTPRAEWQFWVPPPVKAMAQVVLRLDWQRTIGDLPGVATFELFVITFGETDPAGTMVVDSMIIPVDLTFPVGPDGFTITTVDVDITSFFTVPADVTHVIFALERVANGEEDAPGSVRFMHGRTLLPSEAAAAPDILPWV